MKISKMVQILKTIYTIILRVTYEDVDDVNKTFSAHTQKPTTQLKQKQI